jgi:fatty acid synthase subunit alpha, fungi type/fatty acid synthase subunit beta, fungi type
MIVQKLKKVEEIPLSKSIQDFIGRESTLQNEILGDLNLEFVSALEKGEELPLDNLRLSLSTGYSGALGKHTWSDLLPLTTIKAYLTKTWALGPLHSNGVLLLGPTLECPKHLGSEPEAKTWLDTVIAAYAQQAGISLSSGATSGGGGAVINSEDSSNSRQSNMSL